jgi:hypothetical protein
MKCDICGTKEDVITTTTVWGAWGHNAFDFNWCKYENHEPISLCPDCEGGDQYGDGYVLCRYCDAAIPDYDYGRGYLPEEYYEETICPECWIKQGHECRVNIGKPPWSETK